MMIDQEKFERICDRIVSLDIPTVVREQKDGSMFIEARPRDALQMSRLCKRFNLQVFVVSDNKTMLSWAQVPEVYGRGGVRLNTILIIETHPDPFAKLRTDPLWNTHRKEGDSE